jgi:polysaccharide biosynthesis PFTS motif protein
MIVMIPFGRLLTRRHSFPKLILHSLSSDQVFRKGSSNDFVKFISEDRLGFDCSPKDVLVELKKSPVRRNVEFTITRNISIFLLLRCVNWYQYFDYCKALVRFSLQLLTFNRGLGQSFRKLIQAQIEYPLWSSLNDIEEILFVTTQSTMLNLPTPFYLAKGQMTRLMLWYSANNRPVLRKGAMQHSYPNAYELQHFVDLHLIWSHSEANWLSSVGINNVKVVGSLVFSPQPNVKLKNKDLDLVYFDVTAIPRNDIFMSEEMLLENLSGYVDVLDSLRSSGDSLLKGFLKPKRNHGKIHSVDYLNLRTKFNELKRIEVLDHEVDIYDCIGRSRAVLAVPFTSPAFIARELNVPVAFFCLSIRDYQLPHEMDGIPILKSRAELKEFLRKSLSY